MATLHTPLPRTDWKCITVRFGLDREAHLIAEDYEWEAYLDIRGMVQEMIATARQHNQTEAWCSVVLRYGEAYDQDKFFWTFQDGWQ